MEKDFESFLAGILSNQQKISVDMKNLLGIGGESIVFKKIIEKEEKALKVAPYENISPAEITIVQNSMKKIKVEQNQTKVDIEKMTDTENLKLVKKSSEFSSTKFKHENLICYENVIIDFVHNEYVFIIGKFLQFLKNLKSNNLFRNGNLFSQFVAVFQILRKFESKN